MKLTLKKESNCNIVAISSCHVISLIIISNNILPSLPIAFIYHLALGGSSFWYIKPYLSIIKIYLSYITLLKNISAVILFIKKHIIRYLTLCNVVATWPRHIILLVIISNNIPLSLPIALTYCLVFDCSPFWYTKPYLSIIENRFSYITLLKSPPAAISFVEKRFFCYHTLLELISPLPPPPPPLPPTIIKELILRWL